MNYRTKIRELKQTPIHKLRLVEKHLIEASIKSILELEKWLKKNSFRPLLFTGEYKGCNYQYYRQIGKGRYHWRLYDFPDRIYIESHIDKHDPGRGFTKYRTFEKIHQDIQNHLLQDVIKEPKHHLMILMKSQRNQDIIRKFLINFINMKNRS